MADSSPSRSFRGPKWIVTAAKHLEKAKIMSSQPAVLDALMQIIQDRRRQPPDHSYTATLFAGGVDAIAAKVMEESAEVIEAARSATDDAGRDHLVHEAADLVYHLLVLLAYRDTDLAGVEAKLAARFGVSGLEEKAHRNRS